jgi:uncharacterized protein YjbJ (UPF0337 family)
MAESESTETTGGGVLGRVVGKAKSAVGSLIGNHDLQREGNLQQAQSDAEQQAAKEQQAAELRREAVAVEEQRANAAAERDRLRTELAAEDRLDRIDDLEVRREQEITIAAAQEQAAIEKREELQERASDATETAALHRRAVDAAEVARLEREAANAELTADVIDPEAK